MSIMIKEFIYEESPIGRTVVDYNFLDTGIARKTYVYNGKGRKRILRRPHSHDLPHTLIPISGKHRLAYKTGTGEIKIIEMSPAKSYYVPAQVPHDVEMSCGILDSFYSASGYIRAIGGIVTYDEEFFKEDANV
jgi:hypothetical protein